MEQALIHEVPIHSQGSVRRETALLASVINELLRESFPEAYERPYIVHLANSGTEAMEAALKHAFLAWQGRRQAFIDDLMQDRARLRHREIAAQPFDNQLLELIDQEISRLRDIEPVLIALKGSFHGKTAGSLAATSNAKYKSMFPSLPVATYFLAPDSEPSDVERTFKRFDLSCDGRYRFSSIIGMVVELIQGEGGVRTLGKNFVNSAFFNCRIRSLPFIADEIQTGLYRTGEFLASCHYGILPDYLTLGKSLGGGIAKASAVLFRKDLYCENFGMLHSSTFAEDDLSSRVARATLRILRGAKANAKEKAGRVFEQFTEGLNGLKLRYPGVIKEVRGRGLMIGVEFHGQFEDRFAPFLNLVASSDYLGYFYSSYLLNRHGIRTLVTLSNPNTIRIEPGFSITAKDIEQTLDAFESLIRKIFNGKHLALSAHLWPDGTRYSDHQVSS